MSGTGDVVGGYRLGAELGRGASGVVYAAVDEALERKLAIKLLSHELADTPEQRARLEREAKLLAAVQHPNVAVVYGVVEEEGRLALALEFLEGETLAAILERGPLAIEDALDVARQIAEGLEAAHEEGVVHRDLKPANLMRAADGTVKVFDFGLAKPTGERATDSTRLSTEGLALGTPLYMAPEQVRGKLVDRRVDVWAFGCVLWELLCAERVFGGETTADVVHAILEREPDLDRLPARTPTSVRELIARCLRKDARRRLRDVGDARLVLEEALEAREWAKRGEATPATRSFRPGWAGAAVGVLAAAALGLWFGGAEISTAVEPARVLRLALDVPPGDKRTMPRLHPDGRTLVHELALTGEEETHGLLARRLDSFEDVPIPGSDRVDTFGFSPDGERLAVVKLAEGSTSRFTLSLLSLDGSVAPEHLGLLPADLSNDGTVAWLDNDHVVLSARPRSLLVVSTDGSRDVTEVPLQVDEATWPYAPDVCDALPGSEFVLASSFRLDSRGGQNCIVLLDVASGGQRVLVDDSSQAYWLRSGQLLFSRADRLYVSDFDLETLELSGEPIEVARGLMRPAAWMSGFFHASREGSVCWFPEGELGIERRVHWIGGAEEESFWSEEPLAFEDNFLSVSPGGGFLSAVVVAPTGNYELWGSEVGEPDMRPLLQEAGYDFMGGVVDTARRRIFSVRFGGGSGEVRMDSLDAPGEGELIYRGPANEDALTSPRLTRDGTLLSVFRFLDDGMRLLLFDLRQLEAGGPLEPILTRDTTRGMRGLRVSPDGRWLAVSGWDSPPTLMPITPEGQLGAPVDVPRAGLDLANAQWASDVEGADYRLLFMHADGREIYGVDVFQRPNHLEFSEPEEISSIEEGSILDASYVADGRFLAFIADEETLNRPTVHLMLGGVPAPGR